MKESKNDILSNVLREKHMITVFTCSPFRGNTQQNIENAKRYSRYVSNKGYAVFCPHLLYTQFLDDSIEFEREIGIKSGIEFLFLCDEVWVFAKDYDHCSEGMKLEISECKKDPMIKLRFIDPKEI